MASLLLEIEYADLPFISDRTARSILKDLSKAVRRAQAEEVALLLRVANIGRRDRQSINDRLRRPIEEGAVYYVEELRAGSLWGQLTISGVALWLLNATVGQTITDTWKATEIHRATIEYVENERPETFARILTDTLRDRELLTGRAHIFDVEVKERGEDTVISVYVRSDPDAEITADERFESQEVAELARQALERLDAGGPGEDGAGNE